MGLLEWYFLVGIVYTVINGYVRKLDTEGDWGLVFCWMFLWPLAFIALCIMYIQKKINRDTVFRLRMSYGLYRKWEVLKNTNNCQVIVLKSSLNEDGSTTYTCCNYKIFKYRFLQIIWFWLLKIKILFKIIKL